MKLDTNIHIPYRVGPDPECYVPESVEIIREISITKALVAEKVRENVNGTIKSSRVYAGNGDEVIIDWDNIEAGAG